MALAGVLQVPDPWRAALATAALWHDIGEAHGSFQQMLLAPVTQAGAAHAPPADGEVWAKSSHSKGKNSRRGFRHELGSALVYLALHGTDDSRGELADYDLVAYLIASHHGQIRLSIRALPIEQPPAEPDRLYARGWHDGESLRALQLADGTAIPAVDVDLSPMLLGRGSWLDRMLRLRDDPDLGPLRLGLLEAVLRIADWRASAGEAEGATR